jgi:mRNA interferase MazF
VKAGEVWQVILPLAPSGREQSGTRPVIIIQDSAYGDRSPLVLIVPLTSQAAAARFPGTVSLEPTPTNGLTISSVAMIFQARALDRVRFTSRKGEITGEQLSLILDELQKLVGRPPTMESDKEGGLSA